jgi:hypothetical protein
MNQNVIIRGYYCGNWAGTLVSKDDKIVVLQNAYRLWSWSAKNGICLSTIANNGVSGGKISKPVSSVELLRNDCYEIIPATEEAMKSILEQSETP